MSDADIFKAQLYKHYSSLGKKDEFIATWKELDRIVTAIFHPTSGTPLDELFTRYMYYERALTGKKRYYEGFSTNKDEKEGTKIKELQILSSANSDFTEKDIAKRNEDIQNGFVNYLASNNLIS